MWGKGSSPLRYLCLSVRRADGHACFCVVSSVGSRALAAGATWTSRSTSAPWAAREGHTTVIDAAGAIYVIGGLSGGGTYLKDVWISTAGGADRARVGVR